MNKIFTVFLTLFFYGVSDAQTPRSYTSSEILLQIKKLNVLGSVLYIAAHPDDENTRLLSWLANEKLYRTGYLSLTRGDGGQNLIGDEQGVDLGLIRTQELLSARRIDGAEQFFSRAFDFGFSKSPEEAFRFWGHDKILSDVVWVIRKFKPDVIITRFPTTGEGGHGHHTASAILAEEAFEAAADPTKFPEQLKLGVSTWQAKRLLWNTFNFGGTNTQNENQFKLDCGDFNPILGKSYGEIAAASRSQHKSQGFGVPAQRGSITEYFRTIKGDKPENSLMDGVNTGWDRLLFGGQLVSRPVNEDNVQRLIDSIYKNFSVEHPERSLEQLVRLYTRIESVPDPYWREQKLGEVKKIMENSCGLFIEATVNKPFAVPGDSLSINMVVNPRLSSDIINADAKLDNTYVIFDQLKKNVNAQKSYTMLVPADTKPTQPYWLEQPMDKGSFNVSDQRLIGKGESDPWSIDFSMMILDKEFTFTRPVRYKYTDPVKGELYQPLNILPVAEIKPEQDLYLLTKRDSLLARLLVMPNTTSKKAYQVTATVPDLSVKPGKTRKFELNELKKEETRYLPLQVGYPNLDKEPFTISASLADKMNPRISSGTYRRTISYDHIPSIVYQVAATSKSVYLDLKTEGDLVGYIPGAGDKIPEALQQMGYRVVVLKESDLNPGYLKQFDAIVTGVRAYNMHDWLNKAYDGLMQYVKEGGVLLVQYNTNNSIGPVRAKISPYPFNISRNRITDEEAKVNFLLPDHPALNTPNKITEKDFDGWIQERSTYHAEKIDSNYQRILSMKDPGETEQDGSLIITNYGKGRFIYSGLVFFRELPAGVPGAYRLFANLIANNRSKYVK
ncbi:MAG: PIG-L family deacetylase [Chitinophagaceae bacterium]|nr:PIG-L family deacetylase [Chitinophagaceae bacterium]